MSLKIKKKEKFALNKNIFESFGTKWELSTFFYALIAAIAALAAFNMGFHDWDYLWHSALGEWIMENKKIPTNDIFSWIGIEKSLPYTAHSWLFSCFMNCLTKLANGDVVFAAGFVCFVGALLLFLIIKVTYIEKRNVFFWVIAIMVGALCSNPRPQILSYSFFVLTILLLEKLVKDKNSKAFIPLFFIGILWANIHGGTILIYNGLVVFFMFYSLLPNFKIGNFGKQIEGNIELHKNFFKMPKEEKKDFLKEWFKYNKNLKVILIIIMSFMAGILNHYLYSIYTYGFLENNSITKMYISEWQPAKLLSVKNIFFVAIIIVYFLLKKKGKEIVQLHKVIPIVCCILASGIYLRFEMQAILCSIILFCELMNNLTKKTWNLFIWYIFSFLLLFMSVTVVCSIQPKENQLYELDEELVTYLNEKEFKRPYNIHDDGSRLIFAGQKSFIDSRFTNVILKDAIEFENLNSKEKNPKDYVEEMQFDAIILNKNAKSPIKYYMEVWEDWIVDFENKNYIVYVPLIS